MKKNYMGFYFAKGLWGELKVLASTFSEAQDKVKAAIAEKRYDMECVLILPITERS